MLVFRSFSSGGGVVALFEEAPGGGDFRDINSMRNRPALLPKQWLSNIYFHSSLDNGEVAFDGTGSLTHAAVVGSGGSGTGGGSGTVGSSSESAQSSVLFGQSPDDQLLFTHSLGYLPHGFVAAGGLALSGLPIQSAGDSVRYASVYVTTTQLRVSSWASVGATTLPLLTLSYRYLLLRQQRAASGRKMFYVDPVTRVVTLARGRFQSDRRYLQAPAGADTPLNIPFGETVDVQNGAPRFAQASGVLVDPVSATAACKFVVHYKANTVSKTYDPGYGPTVNYTGSFSAPSEVTVGAP